MRRSLPLSAPAWRGARGRLHGSGSKTVTTHFRFPFILLSCTPPCCPYCKSSLNGIYCREVWIGLPNTNWKAKDVIRFVLFVLLSFACFADDFDGPPVRNSSGGLRTFVSANYDDDADDAHCKLGHHHFDLIGPTNALVGPMSFRLLSKPQTISSLPKRFGLRAAVGRAPPQFL